MNKLTKYQEKALDYTYHISLTANAGSGKTTVLAKRYVRILIENDVPINSIVAITFTDKAANELYSKIAKELDENIINSNGELKTRLEELRSNLVSAKISTIHSFCIDVLREYAPEAGIDANFTPIDSRTAEELLNESIDEVIKKNVLNDNLESTIKDLIRLFGSKAALVNKVKILFEKRKTVEKLIQNIYQQTEEEIAKYIQNVFISDFKNLFESKINLFIELIQKLNKSINYNKPYEILIETNRLLNELNSKKEIINRFQIVLEIINSILNESKNKVRQRNYMSSKDYSANKQLINQIENLAKEFNKIRIDDNHEKQNLALAKFGKEISNFYLEILEDYTDKKHQKAYLDFEDLLLLTQNLLINGDVKEQISQKFKFIMVDEYQDTNEVQYNILMPILRNLDSGNLFVVGDEKQSIYKFREAEVRIFNQTKQDIIKYSSENKILDLPHSFRLAPNIALFTNVLFKKLLENANPKFNEVNYNDLICAFPHKEKGLIEFILSDENDETSESDQIAKKVLEIINSNDKKYNYSDIAILCRKRKYFGELEKSFVKFNIPYYIVGGKGFYQQQIIFDIYNYLSFLINPNNDLAFVSILRSPFVGLSDVQLTEISFLKGATFFEKFKEYTNVDTKLIEDLSILEKHIKMAPVINLNELIRTILTETGYWAYIASKENSNQEIANMNKLIINALNFNAQGYHTIYDFILYLKDAIENVDDESQADINSNENSVKIMTIHQAKGLEFKVVILFKLNDTKNTDSLRAKSIAVDREYGILAKLPEGNDYFKKYTEAPIIGLYNFIEDKRNIAEQKRLLYVAVTRAEEQLIISFSHKDKKLKTDSFASMIVDSLQMDLNLEIITITDSLEFMKNENDEYVTEIKEINTEIKILNTVPENNVIKKTQVLENTSEEKILINKIKSSEKNEIISASKISLFLQCPRKYQLTYELGYTEMLKYFKDTNDFEYNNKEDGLDIGGNIGGNIIHKILEKNVKKDELQKNIVSLIEKETEALLLPESKKIKIADEINKVIENFYSTEIFFEINNFNNYKNEMEIYLKENDYYLYGIIDKVVVNENKLIIIDYKTDKISTNTIEEKKESYYSQLMFYSYILRNYYKNFTEFELWLIFIRDVSYSMKKKVNLQQIIKFGETIKESITKIRAKKFDEIKEGCKNMEYYKL